MKILIISPHTDDAELGMGATIARLCEPQYGNDVRHIAFCPCDDSRLIYEFLASNKVLNCPAELLFDFPRRRFPEFRQQILDRLIEYRDKFSPDVVFIPERDKHQDHQVVHDEALRAFKCGIWAYFLPWNMDKFEVNSFKEADYGHLEAKELSLSMYSTQSGRQYFSTDAIISSLFFWGMVAGVKYAEPFRQIRCFN